MKAKTWITVFAVISLLLIAAAGFFCFASSKKYADAIGSWNDKVGTIKILEKKVPKPTKENVADLKKLVGVYGDSVDQLFNSLAQFQKELDYSLQNTQFQEKFKQKVEQFSLLAREEEFELDLETDFQLGFDAYANSLPTPKIVPILNYEMEAIDNLLGSLVESGAESLERFDRDLIPGEVGGPKEQEISSVHKYPIRMEFTANHNAFQEFLNDITNDTDYFYIVSVLKILNEEQEGPQKDSDSGEIPRFENAETFQVADINDLRRWGFKTVSASELESAAREEGFTKSGKDAQVLMGQEKLEVFMKVEVVRFIDPNKEKPSNKLTRKEK